jgi:hypothetical protein
MPEFRANSLDGNASRDENRPQLRQRRLDNSERCSRYTYAPDKSDDSRSWYSRRL